MAAEVSVSFSHYHNHRRRHLSSANHRQPFIRFPRKPTNYYHNKNLSLSLSASSSHSPSHSPTPLQNPTHTGRFLTTGELENLESLEQYSYHQQLESGLLWIRLMREEEVDMTVTLLSESFAESMMMPSSYLLLEFLVKNYMIERREMMPHNATLLGIYRENGEEDFELAGTVELTFDRKGANANPPTPKPPNNSPYICNMAVRKPLRRRGIGWHLLKAGEELITKMGSSEEVYLHCRMIDEGPFNMYMKAGYSIVNTDSVLTWLKLQRRRHLMRKQLPISDDASEMDFSNEQLAQTADVKK